MHNDKYAKRPLSEMESPRDDLKRGQEYLEHPA